jgi:rare lipoprotein A
MRRRRDPRCIATAALVAILVTAAAPPASAVVQLPAPLPPLIYDLTVSDTTRRALELERTIADMQAEQTAIETRMKVTADQVLAQSAALEKARTERQEAQNTFNERAVWMYKFTGYDELALLLDSRSWQDLVSRTAVLASILEVDRRSLAEASVLQAQAEFEASQLDTLRAQDADLRLLLEQRVELGKSALAEQRQLIAGLDPAGLALVTTQQAADARTREAWRKSSIRLGTRVRQVKGTVSPYPYSYLVSEFHPRTFATSGITYSAMCSWYGPGFNGKPTASGQVYNQDDFTCASRTLAFGTWLALTRDGKRIVVVVTDRGPYVSGRDLDLSMAAAKALGIAGVGTVQVEVVTPKT